VALRNRAQQQESFFFRLPWELRGEIYFYHVWEADDYHHDGMPAKLRTGNTKRINLALIYICKQIFEEMSIAGLKTNNITFRAILD
jgi:hypothetical protein